MRFHATPIVFSLAMCFTAIAQSPLPVPVGRAAVVDLMKPEGVKAFNAQWRYSDARIVETAFTAPGPDHSTPGVANVTYDIVPHAGAANFDDSKWTEIAADSLGERRAGGKVCFNWYRITLTMPERIDGVETAGTTAVLTVTVDDYAEVWVNGQLPRALNQPNPNLVQGFNLPNRVTIAQDIKPGASVEIAVFGINGPISAAPANYIWFREARVEFYPQPQAARPRSHAALDEVVAEASPRQKRLLQCAFGDRAVRDLPVPTMTAHAMRTQAIDR